MHYFGPKGSNLDPIECSDMRILHMILNFHSHEWGVQQQKKMPWSLPLRNFVLQIGGVLALF